MSCPSPAFGARCPLCGLRRPSCGLCTPTLFEAALRVAENAAAQGEPVPVEAARVLLADLDDLERRRPGLMVRLLLHEPEQPRPDGRPTRAP